MHRRAVVVAVSRAARGLLAPGAVTRPTTAAAWLATPSLRSPARSLHVSSGSAATYWRGDRGDDVPVSKLEAPRTPLLSTGLVLCPQQSVYVVERLGKFHRILEPGLHVIIPLVDRVAYAWSLKEEAIPIHAQTAITRDNVAIQIDGVLYVRVVDAKLASYGVENLLFAVVQLAQSAMRNEIGKISLDKTFEERDTLNHNIVRVINEASTSWGLQCLRYEIKDIAPPRSISAAMEMQAEAERRKRASILASEGDREAAINVAEGQKKKTILESEATMAETINRAKGDASAILARAEATADGVRILAAALAADGGQAAAQLRVAEQYVSAFSNLAKAGNTIILPANASDAASMVSQALAVYRTVSTSSSGTPGGSSSGGGGGLTHGTDGGADAVQATQAAQKRQPRASGAALDVSGGEEEVGSRAEAGHTRRFTLQRQ